MQLDIQRLVKLVDTLMGPQGCPWGKKQTPDAFSQYIIEEAYEVLDAIREQDPEKIEEELGDVLFAYLCTLASALKAFKIDEVKMVEGMCEKAIRRHPHVFDDPRPITFEELRVQWEKIKAQERKLKGKKTQDDLFASVAQSMPVVTKAMKYVELGTSHGFEYEPDLNTLEGRFMQLVIDGLNEYENLEKVFDESIQDYCGKFKNFLAQTEATSE